MSEHHQHVKKILKCLCKAGLYAKVKKYEFYSESVEYLVRCGSHWDGSLQDGLGDEWTCRTTLALAYVLHHLSAAWLQLQMMGRNLRWE